MRDLRGDYRLRRYRGEGRIFHVGWEPQSRKEDQWAGTEKTRQRGLGLDKAGEVGGKTLQISVRIFIFSFKISGKLLLGLKERSI